MSTAPTELDVVDAWERVCSGDATQSDIEVFTRAGNDRRTLRFIHDYCPALRPEDFLRTDHPNAAVVQIRLALWTTDRVPLHQQGCRVSPRKRRFISGWSQTVWKQTMQDLGRMLPRGLEDVNLNVFNALGDCDSLSDPRTGVVATPDYFRDSSPAMAPVAYYTLLETMAKCGIIFRMLDCRVRRLKETSVAYGSDTSLARVRATEQLSEAMATFIAKAKREMKAASVHVTPVPVREWPMDTTRMVGNSVAAAATPRPGGKRSRTRDKAQAEQVSPSQRTPHAKRHKDHERRAPHEMDRKT
ncbi:hypothetical protein MBLNU459_g7159t1 [Dothideomycetes sp. NU459]